MLLNTKNLISGYDNVEILRDINFSIEKGEITCLLGPNGAGKSTLMRTISGHLSMTGGELHVFGKQQIGLTALEMTKLGVGYVPQEHNVFGDLSVYDNLKLSGLQFEGSLERMDNVLDRFPVLKDRFGQQSSTLSGGERQTLAIATALITGPKILLLDEPTAGLAPLWVDRIVEWVTELAQDGLGVVWVVEQNPEKILKISKSAFVLKPGKPAAKWSTKSLLEPGQLEEVLFEATT